MPDFKTGDHIRISVAGDNYYGQVIGVLQGYTFLVMQPEDNDESEEWEMPEMTPALGLESE